MLERALKYLKLGLSILPIRSGGKEPLIPWTEFQTRRASEEEVRSWFQKWPDANIGIITGAISQVVVVDLDGEEGLEQAKRLHLNSSVVTLTGTGKHLWYKHPGGIVMNAVRKYPGIDIRGDAGYVVVAPSIHENGKRYRWLKPLNLRNLPDFPNVFQIGIGNGTLADIKYKQEGWIAKALEEMKIGNIDDTLTSILGRLRHDGYSASDSLRLLEPHARTAGAEEGHLEAKIENIWNRYEPRKLSVSQQSGMSMYETSKSRYEPKPLGRVVESFQQSRSVETGLIIHSPTNPDSIKQYKQCSLGQQSGADILSTGYAKLDALCIGGLKSSRLFTVAARTGTGKTNWLLGCAKHLCETGKKVLLFSTEMPYTEIWARYKATLAKPESFDSHQFFVCDSFTPSLEKVEEAINQIKPDVFMFDHINHVSEEHIKLGEFMQGLNWLKRKYDCVGMVTAQLNRSADWVDLKTGQKVEPRMSMIKGSGTIEQASSRILLLSETKVTPEYTEIIGVMDKNDNGTKGLIHFGLFCNPWRVKEL